jgi:hypothetical protein
VHIFKPELLPLDTAANRLPIPSLSSEHPACRARIAAHILRRDANILATAGVNSTHLIAAAVGAGGASRSATLGARKNTSALALSSSNAQAVGGAAGHVLAALRSSASEDLRNRRSDTCTGFAGLSGAASVAAGAAVGGVGLQVFASVWREAAKSGGGGGARADGLGGDGSFGESCGGGFGESCGGDCGEDGFGESGDCGYGHCCRGEDRFSESGGSGGVLSCWSESEAAACCGECIASEAGA